MKYYLGIDLGGTNIATGVINENYEFLAHHHVSTLGTRPFEVVVRDMADAAREVLHKAGLTEQDIEYVGVGAPSTIDPRNHHIVFANNLGWKEMCIRDRPGPGGFHPRYPGGRARLLRRGAL